jgi:D-glycerate 3-kinase
LEDFLARERLPASYAETVATVAVPLAGRVAAAARSGGIVVGLCGPQASGKSTLTAVLARLLEDQGLRGAVLSLDDLYLTRAERAALGREVHPLLATRGVPGTHDVALGVQVLAELRAPGRTLAPRFDKAADDRGEGAAFEGPADVVIFEGWCVGAIAQPATDLAEPVNDLERERDADGVWRAYVNAALAGPYRSLFDGLDLLVLLQAPGFEVVLAWRQEQERKLRERLAREGAGGKRAMSDAEVAGFIAHYERLTRWILAEMPARADVVVALDAERNGSLQK